MVAHRMSRVDTAWRRMDNDVNLMMIVGVWLLAPRIGFDALCRRVTERLLPYERFRQKVVDDAAGAMWVDDDAFELHRHVLRETLSWPPGMRAEHVLQARCGELAATALDAAHPLWQLHLIEDYDGGSAIIVRVHHCIADGIALIAVMMSITDGAAGAAPPLGVLDVPYLPEAPDAPDAHGNDGNDGDDGETQGLAEAVVRPLTELTIKAIGLYAQRKAFGIDALTQAPALAGLHLARSGVQALGDVAALARLADDSPTPLKGRGSGRKRVAWNDPLPLDEVKAVGHALGCSVNDVLLACAAGAIGAYLRARGEDAAGKQIRALVPVNLRPLDEAWKLGNRFGLAPLMLPIGIDNPIERVYALRSRMGQLKGSFQPLLSFGVLSLAGLLTKPLQDALLALFAKKATAVMTNVPGPPQPLRLLGSTIRRTMFWVPSSGDIGLGVSILSYAGGVQFGLIADAALCPEPQAIIDGFAPEFEKLLLLTLMLPWGEAA